MLRTPIKTIKQSTVSVLTAVVGVLVLSSPNHAAVRGQDRAVSSAASQDSTASDTPTSLVDENAAGTISQDDVYSVDFFSQYTPQNAFDMIRRLPGFSFNRGSNARGFGGNAGNVLIDGARPTSKSVGLEGLLKRIPAAQVVRIEILRGGVGASEAAGQSLVANVIRKNSGSSGTYTLKVRRAPDGRLRPNLEASLTSSLGVWNTSFDIDIGQGVGNSESEIRDLDAAGTLLSSSVETRPRGGNFVNVTGRGSRSFAGGKLALNGRLAGNTFTNTATRSTFLARFPDAGQPDSQRSIFSSFRNRNAEFGADWTRSFANDWQSRFIGLAVYGNNQTSFPVRTEDFITGTTETSNFLQERTNTEFVGRTTYGKTGSSKFKPEFGVEVARNKLDSDTTEIATDGAESLSNVVVSELRGEAFANFVYQASPMLTFNGGLTAEISNIEVAGVNPTSRTLKFLKPRLTGIYSLTDNIQFTLEAERRVGQLNFNDFAASSQADDDLTTAGNSELEPDKQTRVEATLDWKFGSRGSLKIRALQQWRSDILEQIILPTGEQGLGNAGDATFFRFAANLDLPLDGFINGGLLELGYRKRSSSFQDPILGGAVRNTNGFRPSNLRIAFRHDLIDLKITYGFSYFARSLRSGFRVDELQPSRNGAEVEAFIETTRYFGVKMRLQVQNLNTVTFDRTRLFFSPDRGGDFTGSQITNQRNRPRFRFEVSGTF